MPAINDTVVFGKFSSVKIVNELINGEYGYAVENGVLKVYVGDRDAYSGDIRLQVTQYDANDNILSTGIETLGSVQYNK